MNENLVQLEHSSMKIIVETLKTYILCVCVAHTYVPDSQHMYVVRVRTLFVHTTF